MFHAYNIRYGLAVLPFHMMRKLERECFLGSSITPSHSVMIWVIVVCESATTSNQIFIANEILTYRSTYINPNVATAPTLTISALAINLSNFLHRPFDGGLTCDSVETAYCAQGAAELSNQVYRMKLSNCRSGDMQPVMPAQQLHVCMCTATPYSPRRIPPQPAPPFLPGVETGSQ